MKRPSKKQKSTLLYTLSWAGWKQPVRLVACKIACSKQIIFFLFYIRNTYTYSVLSRNVSKMRITSAVVFAPVCISMYALNYSFGMKLIVYSYFSLLIFLIFRISLLSFALTFSPFIHFFIWKQFASFPHVFIFSISSTIIAHLNVYMISAYLRIYVISFLCKEQNSNNKFKESEKELI